MFQKLSAIFEKWLLSLGKREKEIANLGGVKMKAITEGALLWEPSQRQIENSGVSLFMKCLKQVELLFNIA